MSTPANSEEQNTYFINTESATELARLIQMDQFTTRAMGGPLAEQDESTRFQAVLDVACGPGGWVLDVAYALPKTEAIGVDISHSMIEYANARARSQGLNNASFQVMDVTAPLEFSNASFDLVNGRFLGGFLYKTMWPGFLQECRRVLTPGGIIRLTDLDSGGLTNSQAFEQLNLLTVRALQRTGQGMYAHGNTMCLTPSLEGMLQAAGFEAIRHKAHAINFSAGTEAHADLCRGHQLAFQLMQPFLLAAQVATQQELDQLLQQMYLEMLADDFKGMWYFLTVWGKKPE